TAIGRATAARGDRPCIGAATRIVAARRAIGGPRRADTARGAARTTAYPGRRGHHDRAGDASVCGGPALRRAYSGTRSRQRGATGRSARSTGVSAFILYRRIDRRELSARPDRAL